jgi:hypothetical protein
MSDILQIEKKNAIAAFRKADECGKQIFRALFGEKIFSEKITDRVKTLQDALGVEPPSSEMMQLINYSGTDPEMIFQSNVAKRNHVAKVLKEGVILDFDNGKQEKWYCWFEKTRAGFVFSGTNTYYDRTFANVGSRLCFPTREIAIHFGSNFTELHNLVLSHN